MAETEKALRTELIQLLQKFGKQIPTISAVLAFMRHITKNGKPESRNFTSLARYNEISFEPHFFRLALRDLFETDDEHELFLKKMTDGKLTIDELEKVNKTCETYLISINVQAILGLQIEQQGGKIVATMDLGE